MARKLDDLVKKVIFGATTAIAASFPSKAPAIPPSQYDNSMKSISTIAVENKIAKSELILYKANTNPTDNMLFHRSHRSHSSHRSHASHYSSYTQPTQPVPKKEKDTLKNNKGTTPSQKQEKDSMLIHKFGSRILMRGMQGTDVADLQSLLIKKGYKEVKINALFDEKTEEALQAFQKSKNIEVTGKVDVLTIWHLQHE